MFGPLKKFFGKQPNEETSAPPPPPPPPAPLREPRQAAVAQRPAVLASQSSPPALPNVSPLPVTAQDPTQMIALPLRSVLDVLPESFPQANRALEKGELYLPLGKVLGQLGSGSVKIPFFEIREAAPPGLFPDDSSHDEKPVELPLSEILSRLPASAFSRRTAQKRLDAPPEVRELFGPRGQALAQPPAETSASRPTLKPVASTPGAGKPSLPLPVPVPSRPSLTPLSATSSIPAPSLPPQGLRPAGPAGVPAATTPVRPSSPVSPLGSLPMPMAAAPAAASVSGGSAFAVSLGLISESWPEAIRQEIAEANVPEAQVSLPLEKVEQGMKAGKLSFLWKDLGQWSQPMINTAPTTQATMVDIPMKVIAPLFIAQHRPAKTQKRVAIGENIPDLFSGSGGGVKPGMARAENAALPSAPPSSAPEAPRISMPKVPVSPAAQPVLPTATGERSGQERRVDAPQPARSISDVPLPVEPASVSESFTKPNIPMVKPSEAKTSLVSVPPSPLSTAAPESGPSPAAAETPKTAASVLGEIFGQPSKRDWSPTEIVQKTLTLRGVAGVLIAMQDGLMVAGQVTPPLEAENIAAFLPQIYGRMTQYTNQLNLGGLTSLSLGLGGGSWHILKSGNIYFAVAGKAGETLSIAQLTSIAIELGKQTK